jgi:hypothetical protein
MLFALRSETWREQGLLLGSVFHNVILLREWPV